MLITAFQRHGSFVSSFSVCLAFAFTLVAMADNKKGTQAFSDALRALPRVKDANFVKKAEAFKTLLFSKKGQVGAQSRRRPAE